MIPRTAFSKVSELAQHSKAVAIISPHQSGKTTLARYCFPNKTYVSIENPDTRSFALNDPRNFLRQYEQGAILELLKNRYNRPKLFSLPTTIPPLIFFRHHRAIG